MTAVSAPLKRPGPSAWPGWPRHAVSAAGARADLSAHLLRHPGASRCSPTPSRRVRSTRGYKLNAGLTNYIDGLATYGKQFWNSILYGGLATILTLLIGFPVAYTIAFRGGRYKNLFLFLVIAPFFTSFLIRTISWKILLGDEGPSSGRSSTSSASCRSTSA